MQPIRRMRRTIAIIACALGVGALATACDEGYGGYYQSDYYAGYPLPPNATLIHASDNDPLVMPNMMIRYCHRESTSALKQLAARAGIAGEPSQDGNYSGLVRLVANQTKAPTSKA